MQTGSSERYFHTLVQICKPTGSVVGAGILVNSTSVVTCAHVVAAALSVPEGARESELPDRPEVGVRRSFVDGAESPPRVGEVTQYLPRNRGSRSADIAVLTLRKAVLDLSQHALASFEVLRDPIGVDITAFGFPLDARETIDQTIPATYRLDQYMPNGWISAIATQIQGQEIRKGFSGAPVMHKGTGLLFGMVCEADPTRRTATIIPAEVLREVVSIPVQEVQSAVASESASAVALTLAGTGPGRRIFDYFFPALHYMLTVRLGCLPDPPERPMLEEYLSELKATFENEIASKTYLPGPAKEVGETPAQFGMGRAEFFSPIQQLIREVAGVSSGGDSASAQISALSKSSRRVRSLIDRLLTSHDPLIVLGDPGAGKSITLKQAAIVLSEDNRKRVFPTICIFVALGGWRPPDDPSFDDVEDLVNSEVPVAIRPLLPSLADRQRVVVIFDGLDEMSREHYTQKTEALSKYAERHRGRIHALYSCRIADFSPAFRHRRLVLLPFERSHIRQFLVRQFGNTKLEISGKLYSISEVGRQLESDEFPIEPQNPFSLWLITLYIREKKEWPYTRVALLTFLYDYQFERKRQEAVQNGESFPEKPAMISAWGQLARAITERNRGSDIGVHEVRQMFGPSAHEIIHVGRICGVLHQTVDHEPPLLRFEHQRAQEYFTALNLVAADEAVAWENLWDIPRWQETLVNISQMDGARAPLRKLAASLGSISADDGLSMYKGAKRAELEALAAERLDFAARVLRSIAPSADREEVQSQLTAAAAWLGEHGNPVSVVKVLRIAQQLPQLDLWNTVKDAMQHPVKWVREQAQIVGVTLAGNHGGSPLPENLASAFGDGSILASQPHYFRIAKRLKSPAVAGVSLLVALLFALQTLVLGSVVPVITAILVVPKIRWGTMAPEARFQADATAFFNHWLLTIVLAVSILALVISSFSDSRRCWWITIAAGGSAALLTPLLYFGWLWAPRMSLVGVGGGLISASGLFYVVVPVGSSILFVVGALAWVIFSSFLAVLLSLWSRDSRVMQTIYRVTWKQGAYPELMETIRSSGETLLTMTVIMVIVTLIQLANDSHALKILNRYSVKLPWAPALLDVWLTVCLLVLGFSTLYWVLATLTRIRTRSKFGHHTVAQWTLVVLIGSYVGYLLFKLVNFLSDLVIRGLELLLGRFSGTWLVYGLILLLLLTTAGLACYVLTGVLREVYHWARWMMWLEAREMSAEEFRARIARSSPREQAKLLTVASPKSLRMDASAFHALLADLEGQIKAEPALGKYWSKRAETQDVMRQERKL